MFETLVLCHVEFEVAPVAFGQIALRLTRGGIDQNRGEVASKCLFDVDPFLFQYRDQVHKVHSTTAAKLEHPNSALLDVLRQAAECLEIDLLVIMVEKVADP